LKARRSIASFKEITALFLYPNYQDKKLLSDTDILFMVDLTLQPNVPFIFNYSN